jgi:kynurenine formamidase
MLRYGAYSVTVAAALLGAPAASTANAQEKEHPRPTREDIDRWARELSNWGRWGKDDQLGALNLITPEKCRRAAGLVKEGVTISLARDLNTEKSEFNPDPLVHKTTNLMGALAVDSLEISYHGLAHTHIDALCHVFPGGKMYNGVAGDLVKPTGAARESIHNLKGGVVTRGILIDLPRLRGVPYLEPGTAIYPEDLEAWEKETGVKVEPGDAVLIRTGRWARQKAEGPWDLGKKAAGLDASCVTWLKARDVAVLGSDGVNELSPPRSDASPVPIHELAIAALGVHLVDNCDLEALGQAAEKYKRWDFLLTIAPLAVVGGTGSPVNPIAAF